MGIGTVVLVMGTTVTVIPWGGDKGRGNTVGMGTETTVILWYGDNKKNDKPL